MQKKRGAYHNTPMQGELRGEFTVYRCKTCGREFRRRPYGHSSREYCTYACEPAFLKRRQEEREQGLVALCQAMQVCSDVAFFEQLHHYQQICLAECWQDIQKRVSHYNVSSLPDMEQLTEKQKRQQTIIAYLSLLAKEDE